MKKALITLIFLLATIPCKAQLPVQALGNGINEIARNFTPTSTATSFVASFPPNAVSFQFSFSGTPVGSSITPTTTIFYEIIDWTTGSQTQGLSLFCARSAGPTADLAQVQVLNDAPGLTPNLVYNCTVPSTGAILIKISSASAPQTVNMYVTVSTATPVNPLGSAAQLISGIQNGGGVQTTVTLKANPNGSLQGVDCPFSANSLAQGSGVRFKVAGSGSVNVHICFISIQRTDTTAVAVTVTLVEGTGLNCNTGLTTIMDLYVSGATAPGSGFQAPVIYSIPGGITTINSNDDVCINVPVAAGVSFDSIISFNRY
jgi:hypothetical protein